MIVVRAGCTPRSLGTAQDVIVRFDAERGHDWRTLMQAADFARSIGARLAIEAIFNAVDPQAEASHPVVAAIKSANVEPSAVLVSPRREFKTRPSNMLPAGESDDRRACRCTQGRRVEGEHRCRHAFVLHRVQPQSANRRRRLRLLQHGQQRPCGRRSLGHGDVERLPRGDRQRPETVSRTSRSGSAPARSACATTLMAPTSQQTLGMSACPRLATTRGTARCSGRPSPSASPRRPPQPASITWFWPRRPAVRIGDRAGAPCPLQAVYAELAGAAGAECYDVAIDRPGMAAVAFRVGHAVRMLLANLTDTEMALVGAGRAAPDWPARRDSRLVDASGRPDIAGPYRTMLLSAADTKLAAVSPGDVCR